jgi:hypothetical protein
MTEYTIDVNGKRYKLSDKFREAIEERAEREYSGNERFSCWWKNDDGDPTLVIETYGKMVPWDRLDQLEMQMEPEIELASDDDVVDPDDVDSGNGMAEQKPPDRDPSPRDVNFGRQHFGLTPHRFEEVPQPGGDDPEKIPPKPKKLDEPSLVKWIPRHPDVDVRWDAGEAISPMDSWVEWNVQEKAEQPRPIKDKINSHDAIESLCQIHDCEVVATAEPSNDIDKTVSGSVERKGEDWFEGDVVGDRWNI